MNSLDGEDFQRLSAEDIASWAASGPSTPLLDTVNFPIHMKSFNRQQLRQLCKELRADIVHTVSRCVRLTWALWVSVPHYIFQI